MTVDRVEQEQEQEHDVASGRGTLHTLVPLGSSPSLPLQQDTVYSDGEHQKVTPLTTRPCRTERILVVLR
jgi:hypothetical protein